jgi:hypothetical protein
MTPTVTCDSVLQTSTCAGGNVIVRFTVSGGSFNIGNVFTAQLSNLGGAFTTPVNIGSVPFNLGVILATIPANTNFGIYKVRVITSSPADTSNPSPNFIFVTQVAQLNQIVAAPHNYICPGDSITLTAVNFANSYSWSTGATTSSILVAQPGIYSVTTTDALTCQSTTSDTLVANTCTGIAENTLQGSLHIYANPSNGMFTITNTKAQAANCNLEIFNFLGEKIYSLRILHPVSSINISDQPAGVYFLNVRDEKESYTQKLIIQK